MKLSYYPGCSLHGTSQEFDWSAKAVCNQLGIELEEIEDWNCCGASSAHATNPDLAFSLSSRNLALAEKAGKDVVIPCAACFNRLRTAAYNQTEKGEKPKGVEPFKGDVEILSLLDFLSNDSYRAKIKESVSKPLAGLSVVCYYGCLSVRSPEKTGSKHPDNPVAMDELLKDLGATVHDWSYKTQCCGAGLTIAHGELVNKFTGGIFSMAKRVKADAIVTACPMCFMNLDSQASEQEGVLPVFYFTELMLLAMNGYDNAVGRCFRSHLIDPTEILSAKGLL